MSDLCQHLYLWKSELHIICKGTSKTDHMNSHQCNNIKGFSDNKSKIISVVSLLNIGNTVLHLCLHAELKKYTELDATHIHMHIIKATFHIREEKSILTFTDNIYHTDTQYRLQKMSLLVDTAQYKAVERYQYVCEYTCTGHVSCYAWRQLLVSLCPVL